MLDYKVNGVNGLVMKFAEIEKGIRGEIVNHALDVVADEIKSVMVREAPEDENPRRKYKHSHVKGNLKKSIAVFKSKPGDFPTRYIRPGTSTGIDAYYAMFVERGHLVRTKTSVLVKDKKAARAVMSKVPANPFMKRTFKSTESWAKSTLDRLISEGIKKQFDQ